MHVREIEPSDLDALTAFWRRIGNPDIIGPETWRRRWSGKPLSFVNRPNLPVGWALEDNDGRIAGHLGNVPLVYEFGGKTLVAAVASDWDVEKNARSCSLALISRFFAQESVDLFLDTFGTNDAIRICTMMGARKLPLPYYDRPLFWITRYPGFAAGILKDRHVPAPRLFGLPAGLMLRLRDGLCGRGHIESAGGFAARKAAEFDERFDEFRQRLRKQKDKLILARDSRFLDWYFGDRLKRAGAWIMTCEYAGQMVGYSVCVRKDNARTGLKRAWMADLQVDGADQASVLPVLLAGNLDECRARGVHVLEAVGFGSEKRLILESLGPRSRRFPNWPFVYKAADRELARRLEDPACWDPCPADGADAF